MDIFGKQKILIPQNVDMQKWAVVACDQFTSEPKYWQQLEKFIGDSPSALKLVLPEIYLSDTENKTPAINKNMTDYLNNGILKETDGFVLVEREVELGKNRIGLVLSVDLESYDWRRIRCPIRATEDTIVERLPARVSIRKGAAIELPHILLLIDDKDRTVLEPLYANKDKLEKLYDFELNMGGGHIAGYQVADTAEVVKKLNALASSYTQTSKYGWDAGLLFAVGDGNHSLAAAKSWWEQLKPSLTEEQQLSHPARFALCEVVNIYDEAMLFEPIHRVLLGTGDAFIDALRKRLSGNGKLKMFTKDKEYILDAPEKSSEMIKAVQTFIEEYIKNVGGEVDYVHGEDHLEEVVEDNAGAIGILMPYFAKEELFDYVLNVGNLPKKAFSIGGPEFKKYYLEAKVIK
ncbi:MAG: DUF1015 domain-containing protein [Clostridia bacterium]|nr:DUF1015 domain-containing protein [Clostridia bacterium]